MKKTIINLLLLSTISFCTAAQGTQAKSDESVRISSVPYPLNWDNTPQKFAVTDKGITIEAQKGTDLFVFVDGNYYNNTASKLLFHPDSNFVFKAKVSPEFNEVYDGGAILVYSDKENWANFLFEKNERNTYGVVSSFVKNKISDGNYHTELPSKEVYMKVAKSGKIFNFYYSLDGQKWVLTRTFPYSQLENMRIGFYAQAAKGPGCKVHFTEISYNGKAFKDFFTGE
ncbi:DUF1349 domain-containing protein [Solitalea canadensis]|uniref:DUF1349 domain-containing protein n=1 Tax=Solitalea canadensis (strain ATCC 29591 / DSM 3403 / JCM 21819 / LMG 8368 / NBRC 15130 / NCIMB 12057 / USAM 9D) TaxID=929556 RepID=H8KP81_SOLCM|nr:DUF1349 domain-containing protein [Solitalea canadensis]AFD05718.1 hypothetical protein Solca_0588 [Solitalea canadensis DSM 3403]